MPKPPSLYSTSPSAQLQIIIVLLILALTCEFAGCGGGSGTPPPKTLRALQVSPGKPSITLGANQQFTARGTFTDGSTQDLSAAAAWSSSNIAVATMNSSGLSNSLSVGRVLIPASTILIVVVSESAGVGRFAYVAGNVDGTISAFTVNAATGQLRHNGYVFAGHLPEAIVVDAGNKFVYVLNSGDDTISAFSINPSNGALTVVPGSPFPTGSVGAVSLTVDPSGASPTLPAAAQTTFPLSLSILRQALSQRSQALPSRREPGPNRS